jgi:hypothetical protein
MSRVALLSVWTVYDHPRDHPDSFVARRHEVLAGGTTVATPDAVFAPTLEEVRAKLPRDLVPIARSPGDDPVIVESWI